MAQINKEETFLGNVLHSGKKEAVLRYLGYRQLENIGATKEKE